MGKPAPRFETFIGHDAAIRPLVEELAGAKALGVPLSHILLIGISGGGKTTLARALAAHRKTRLIRVFGTISRDALTRKLLHIEAGEFLFIDEAHRLSLDVQEMLFEVIDRGRIPGLKRRPSTHKTKRRSPRLQPFTLVLATDRPGQLLGALRKRITRVVHLERYNLKEMREIVATVAARQKLVFTGQATTQLSRVCHGLPRRAKQLLDMFPKFCRATNEQIGVNAVASFLLANGLDADGLGPTERKYLRFLQHASKASLETLALALDVDKDYVRFEIESLLVHHGLVRITPAGRRLTKKGKQRAAACDDPYDNCEVTEET